ncbi:MAG: nicotinate phosphoribosyltransferase [Candidatus Auribacter fodinae]|jgi:nicotinate phosphoribosyltransferase|uniref:Nicotinate phosphoribosyltransferase n=1 Tax=Candidatus Auribacter fodinae TaxID=2093366 RepID=A0A3A4R8V1_9BACT|nr:MAG: nicotinate phosphoribosyltransferase [Candidatus Auribacter fodinae]
MSERHAALNTDLYELTMSAGYFFSKKNTIATFELFFRNLPDNRQYLVFSGLKRIVEYLLSLRFTGDEIAYIREHDAFRHIDESFFEYLKKVSFTGTLRSVPEGTIVFDTEPVIQVTAPIIEAQLIETYLLASVHIETLVASKAARVVDAAYPAPVLEFGSRRAHGTEAAVLAARAAYIAGCAGTSNVKAGMEFGIPTYGTMAHAWVEAFDEESDSFETYHKLFPHKTIFIVDTYDVPAAIEKIIRMGKRIDGVRIDSGDPLETSRAVRAQLDSAGLTDIKIFASGNLDEYKIRELVSRSAPVDGYGVGTQMVTSADCPSLNVVYKLVQVTEPDGTEKPCFKMSSGKKLYPGKKQVYRISEGDKFTKDYVCRDTELVPKSGKSLLETYIEHGKPVRDIPRESITRQYVMDQKKQFDAALFDFPSSYKYHVEVSDGLEKEYLALREKMMADN